MTMPETHRMSEGWPVAGRSRFWLGVQKAWPVVMGYGPIGFALGVLAVQAGLTPVETGAMSLLVYAGASQFIGVGMLGADAGLLAIAATIFLVNVRHVLMSAALSPYFRDVRRPLLAGLAFLVTDESFAISSAAFAARGTGDARYFAGLSLTAYVSWFLSTLVGAVIGGAVQIPAAFGLDFALTAMFIGLLAGHLRDRPEVITAVVAGVVAIAIAPTFGRWSIMVAAIVAASAGVWFRPWTSKSS